MNLLDNNYLCNLYNIYKNLFTPKQQEYFKLYYLDNYTMQEIADVMGISKAATQDAIKKIEKKLLNYEKKLNIYKERIEIINKLNKFIETKDEEIIEKIIKNI